MKSRLGVLIGSWALIVSFSGFATENNCIHFWSAKECLTVQDLLPKVVEEKCPTISAIKQMKQGQIAGKFKGMTKFNVGAVYMVGKSPGDWWVINAPMPIAADSYAAALKKGKDIMSRLSTVEGGPQPLVGDSDKWACLYTTNSGELVIATKNIYINFLHKKITIEKFKTIRGIMNEEDPEQLPIKKAR